MRKIWKAIKIFGVPITHPYIQNLTWFDLEFIDWSDALDDPKFYDKMKNTVYDEEYEEFEREAEQDELTDEEKAMMEEIMKNKGKSKEKPIEDDFIPVEESTEDPDDWEEVK